MNTKTARYSKSFGSRTTTQTPRMPTRPQRKRDKARRMLAAIDTNAGGQLLKAGQPTDETLALNLVGKPMVIKCMIWSMPDRERPGEVIEGNWIAAVGPASKPQHIAEAKPRAAPSAPAGGSYGGKFRDFKVDDEIPF